LTPAVSRQPISPHSPAFEVETQAQRWIIRTSESGDHAHEFDNRRSCDGGIECHNARLMDFRTVYVTVGHLTRAICFGERFDPNSIGIDMPPTGQARSTRTHNDDTSCSCRHIAFSIHAKCSAHVNDGQSLFIGKPVQQCAREMPVYTRQDEIAFFDFLERHIFA
jgi:hypothetical protein